MRPFPFPVKIETERLYFREFTADDAQLIYDMHLDPEITRYTGDPFPWTDVESAREILVQHILPQYKLGIGRWAAHLKLDHAFIGWCGLKDIGHEVDLGYRYMQQYWGKGYATESAKAVLEFGISKGLAARIIGRADLRNTASVKVLKKIGLKDPVEYVEEDGTPSVKFFCRN